MLPEQAVRKALQAHELGEAEARKVRLVELKDISPSRSAAIFAELWGIWAKNRQPDLRATEELRLRHLLKRRRRLDRLGRRPSGS